MDGEMKYEGIIYGAAGECNSFGMDHIIHHDQDLSK